MPPKAVFPHICGEHLCGQYLCGYEVGADTPVMLAPKLFLNGGAVAPFNRAQAQAPLLDLQAKTFGLSVSSTLTLGDPLLFLDGGPHIVGKEKAMVPTTPGNIILYPTVEEDWLLIPTTESNWVLVPTSEREM